MLAKLYFSYNIYQLLLINYYSYLQRKNDFAEYKNLDHLTKLLSDFYLAKVLDISAKSFFACR